jgi:hypothetical protein
MQEPGPKLLDTCIANSHWTIGTMHKDAARQLALDIRRTHTSVRRCLRHSSWGLRCASDNPVDHNPESCAWVSLLPPTIAKEATCWRDGTRPNGHVGCWPRDTRKMFGNGTYSKSMVLQAKYYFRVRLDSYCCGNNGWLLMFHNGAAADATCSAEFRRRRHGQQGAGKWKKANV